MITEEISQFIDFPQKNSIECEGYEEVQTFTGITENNLVKVNFHD